MICREISVRCTAARRLAFSLFLLAYCMIGCGHVVSPQARSLVDQSLSVEMLFRNPSAYKGKVILVGGTVVAVRNSKAGCFLEIIEHPLDSRGRPRDKDVSHGRLILLSREHLDPELFARGRFVTAVGEVLGEVVHPLDEIEYPYPLLGSKELHIIDSGRQAPLGISVGVSTVF